MELRDFGAWLRRHQDHSDRLTLDRVEVAELHAELGRLRQSTDRMRKQNGKLRKRIAKIKAGDVTALAEDDGDSDS